MRRRRATLSAARGGHGTGRIAAHGKGHAVPATWDVFISHASEDKFDVALPLASLLKRSGLEVWIDRFELKIGDSLREKIDDGLLNSALGVVVLSPSFFAKAWTKAELNALFSLHTAGGRRLVTVLHDIDARQVATHSPLLADRVSVSTAAGIADVAAEISAAVAALEDAPSRRGGLAATLAGIVEGGPVPDAVAAFLTCNRTVLKRALGFNDYYDMRTPSPQRSGLAVDLIAGGDTVRNITLRRWRYFRFLSAVADPNDPQTLATVVRDARELDAMIRALPPRWSPDDPGGLVEDWYHSAVVVVSRREQLQSEFRRAVLSQQTDRVRIRSYDWLLDACLAASPRRPG